MFGGTTGSSPPTPTERGPAGWSSCRPIPAAVGRGSRNGRADRGQPTPTRTAGSALSEHTAQRRGGVRSPLDQRLAAYAEASTPFLYAPSHRVTTTTDAGFALDFAAPPRFSSKVCGTTAALKGGHRAAPGLGRSIREVRASSSARRRSRPTLSPNGTLAPLSSLLRGRADAASRRRPHAPA